MKFENYLSMPETERSLRSSALLKRIGRVAWVAIVNCFVAWFMYVRLRTVGFPTGLNFQLCFEFTIEVISPIAGIALEIFRSKFAKLVNVGCFAVAGCFWLIAAVWDHADPFFGVLLIFALGLFVVAGLTNLVYRITRSAAYPALVEH